MRERPILISYRRFEQLQALLFARGYLVDPGGRDPNEWRDDPPLGLVRLKGVAMRGGGDEAEPDPRITFSIAEFWSADRVEDAYEENGYCLAGYAYHGQVGDVSLRYCFDPQRHPEMPYHRHPPGGNTREPWRRVSAEEALEGVDALVAAERRAGRLRPALRAEGRVSVEFHPVPPCCWGFDTASLQGGPDEQRA